MATTAVNEHRGTTVSLNVITRRSNYMKFAQVTPANRSTLSMKHGCSSTSQLLSSRDQPSQDAQVVDLTADRTTRRHLTEHTLKSLGPKKAKITDRSKDATGLDNVSSKLQHNVESRALPAYRGEWSTPPSMKSTIEQACEKNDSNAGPAFLKLAREKLTTAEYGEFVEFMKALKLKTMHIKDSLEAIAKLFSSPGRLPLLEGFRVFVPKNHLPLYEQLVQRYTVANT